VLLAIGTHNVLYETYYILYKYRQPNLEHRARPRLLTVYSFSKTIDFRRVSLGHKLKGGEGRINVLTFIHTRIYIYIYRAVRRVRSSFPAALRFTAIIKLHFSIHYTRTPRTGGGGADTCATVYRTYRTWAVETRPADRRVVNILSVPIVVRSEYNKSRLNSNRVSSHLIIQSRSNYIISKIQCVVFKRVRTL